MDQAKGQAMAIRWKDVTTRSVDVGGVQFAYRELGTGAGVPLVFLHHLMAVLDDWDPRVIDGIAAKRRVIAFDNRGVGGSAGRVPLTIDEMGRDAIAFIRAGPGVALGARAPDGRGMLHG